MLVDISDIKYVPRGHKGGRQILVKEVECKDYAQDDSNRAK